MTTGRSAGYESQIKKDRKMKMSTAIAALVLALLANNSAQAATTRFFGMIQITARTATCTIYQIGSNFPLSFYPADVGTNGTDSSVTFNHQTEAENFTLPNASFDNQFRPVTNTSVFNFVDTAGVPQIVFSTQSPAVIAANTNFVKVTGRIKGWSGPATCIYNFRMIGTRTVF